MAKDQPKGFYDDVEDCVASLRQVINIYDLEDMGLGNVYESNKNGHFIVNYH